MKYLNRNAAGINVILLGFEKYLILLLLSLLQCCPGYVATDMSSHKGPKTIDEG